MGVTRNFLFVSTHKGCDKIVPKPNNYDIGTIS